MGGDLKQPTRVLNRGRRVSRCDWPWALSLSGLTAIVAAMLSRLVFGGIPHVQDSIAQLFQARIFTTGHLWAPAPPLSELFDYANMILKDGRWYSQYPPGQALLLSPGVWLGIPWITNPLLGGLTILGIYYLGLELFDRATARIAALLGLISPFLLLMSAEFMSHAGSLFAITFFLLFYFRAVKSARLRTGCWAGLFCALAILVRPYSACGMLLPCAAHGSWMFFKERRCLWRPLLAIVGGAGAGLMLLLLYNWGTTGHPLRFGYAELHGTEHALGFGKGLWGLGAHTLAAGLRQSFDRLVFLNGRLFEWPVTSLWPMVLGLLLPSTRFSLGRRWLLGSFLLSLVTVHIFYWYHDANDCFGPRYLYEALAPILLISANGLILAGRGIVRYLPPVGRWTWSSAFAWALVCMAVFALIGGFTRWPRLFRPPPAAVASPFDYYGRSYWAVSPALGESVAAQIHGRAIVFIDTRIAPDLPDHVRRTARHLKFGSGFAHQHPNLTQARIVYAHLTPADWHPPLQNARASLRNLMREHAKHFPGRTAYYYREGFEAPRRIGADTIQ